MTAQSRASRPDDRLDLGDDEAQPRPEKAPGAFRTISEVSEELDIPAHVLRFWETKFPHLNPMKRGGGRRYYRPADVALLRGIRKMLYEDGLTIKGLQKTFRERGPRHVSALGDADTPASGDTSAVDADATPADLLASVIARLEAVRDALRA